MLKCAKRYRYLKSWCLQQKLSCSENISVRNFHPCDFGFLYLPIKSIIVCMFFCQLPPQPPPPYQWKNKQKTNPVRISLIAVISWYRRCELLLLLLFTKKKKKNKLQREKKTLLSWLYLSNYFWPLSLFSTKAWSFSISL